MNKIYKKITLLSILFIISCFLSCQLNGFLNSDFEIEKKDGEVILVKYKGTSENVTIPKGITIIGERAFYDCKELNNISIPDSVISIEDRVFDSCSSLTNIAIPNSVTYIGRGAFVGCTSLTNITIPNFITYLGEGSFQECTNLISMTIPKTVTNIGDYVLLGCDNLTSINVEDENPNYLSIDGVLFTKNKKILIQFPASKKVNTYIVPEGVKEIAEGAFNKCERLTKIIMPNTVTNIGEGAFRNCIGLSSITIPNSVTYIPSRAFADCYNLTSITIPKSVKSVGGDISVGRAFEGCTNLIIYGYKGSYIEKYAKKKKIPFKAI